MALLAACGAGQDEARSAGTRLYRQRCAGCHGADGGGEGALLAAGTTLSVKLNSVAWSSTRTDAQIDAAIRNGVGETAMPPTRDLDETEMARLVAHVRTLAQRPPNAPGTPAAANRDSVRRVLRDGVGRVTRRLAVGVVLIIAVIALARRYRTPR